jgi:hypothetical protein
MKLPRRNFLHLAAGAAVLPAVQPITDTGYEIAGRFIAESRLQITITERVGGRWSRGAGAALQCDDAMRRRRHQPRRPLLAKIRPGSPAPTMGPGTADGADGSDMVTVIGAEHKTATCPAP